MIRINCDIGERGGDHPVDLELMKRIHIANIACGGHAGDIDSVAVFRRLALDNGVEISAHLSYPDRGGFGRRSMDMPPDRLLESLDEQHAQIPDAVMVKFHGGLYNDSIVRKDLADALAGWLVRKSIESVITAHDSALAVAARERGLGVIAEVFAERRYRLDSVSNRIRLMERENPMAVIHDVDDAVRQAMTMMRYGFVDAHDGESVRKVPVRCETICIHSDSAIALDLAERLYGMTGGRAGIHA
jgi:UPF0271 protein